MGDGREADIWPRVQALFAEAVDRPAGERAAFLDEACAGAPRLRTEVESLLAAHERSGGFLEPPVVGSDEIGSAAAHALPTRIGPYRILAWLGAGGMGVVYLAEDTRLGRLVALKSVLPQAAADPARRDRLEREARLAASLAHPGIATVYALEDIGGALYVASEYVRGETLRDELRAGPLGAAAAVETTIGILRAIEAAHARGIVHRDLKPENVMRTPEGAIKVLDFGLARALQPQAGEVRLTHTDGVIGTPAYMAPEQIRGAAPDARSDLFSVGVILYELVSGTNPFRGGDAASTIARILEMDPPALARAPDGDGGGTGRIDRVIGRCLAKSPDDRIASAADFIAALERARAGEDSPSTGVAAASSAVNGARWWWQFHQAAAAIGYALLLLPLWRVRDLQAGSRGLTLFLVALVAVVVAGSLRLHLWFASRLYPAEWRSQHATATRWIRAADVGFVLTIAVAGLLALTVAAEVGLLLVAAAAAVLVSFAVIEPATTRAAFPPG
jgi:serine/threonine-protein kinase